MSFGIDSGPPAKETEERRMKKISTLALLTLCAGQCYAIDASVRDSEIVFIGILELVICPYDYSLSWLAFCQF